MAKRAQALWTAHVVTTKGVYERHSSGRLVLSEKVGPELLGSNRSTLKPSRDSLNRPAPIRRHLLGLVKPTPDMSLRDGLAGFLGEQTSKSPLPLHKLDCAPQRGSVTAHGDNIDKYTCPMQQAELSISDKSAGREYFPAMKREKDWGTLKGRLAYAMAQMKMDDKAVAAELSRLAGKNVSWQTVQSIRLGASKTSSYLSQIASVLGCDPLWLSTGQGEPYAPKTVTFPNPYGDLEPAAAAIARRWQSLSPRDRARVNEVLEAFEAKAQAESREEEAPAQRKREKA